MGESQSPPSSPPPPPSEPIGRSGAPDEPPSCAGLPDDPYADGVPLRAPPPDTSPPGSPESSPPPSSPPAAAKKDKPPQQADEKKPSPVPKPNSYRALLQAGANGDPVSSHKLFIWRREEDIIRAAFYYPRHYRHCGLEPAHFTAPLHGLAWQALFSLIDKDPERLKLSPEEFLSEIRLLDERHMGGPRGFTWVMTMLSEQPHDTSYGLGSLVRDVLTYHRLRRVKRQNKQFGKRVDKDTDLAGLQADYVAAASDMIYTIRGEGIVEDPISGLPWDASTKELGSLVRTGNSWLDAATGGGHGRGEMMVIGGGTNHGKSYAAERLLVDQGNLGQSALYISCEDPRELMYCRLVSDFSDPTVEPKEVRNRKADAQVVDSAIDRMKLQLADRIYVVERKKPTILEVCSAIRSYHYRFGLDMVLIDYLQAIRSSDEPMQNKVQEMGFITSELKRCFTECFVSGVVFSQYSRESYKDGAEPGINSCKYCGDIENESEIMVLLWRDADGLLHSKVPKLKWSRGGKMRFIVPVNEKNGCHQKWQEDFDEESG